MKLTIGKKLGLGFFSMLLLLLIMGGVVNTKMVTMGDHAKKVQTSYLPSIELLGEMKASIIDVERLLLRYLLEPSSNEQAKAALSAQMNAEISELQTVQQEYETLLTSNDEMQKQLALLVEQEDQLGTLTTALLEAGQRKDSAAIESLTTQLKEPFDQALAIIEQMIERNSASSSAALTDSITLFETGLRDVNLLSITAILLGIIIAVVMTRMISRPIIQLSEAAQRIASGDLTAEPLQLKRKDEIRDLAESFEEMASNLRTLIRAAGTKAEQVAASAEELTASSEQIRCATEQIAVTMEQLADGSEEQVRSVQQSQAAFQEMAEGMQHIAANAEDATTLAHQASSLASEGTQTVEATIRQMNVIHETISRLSSSITGLDHRSQDIGQIVEVITGIARQTNLLALNAAIEAARVGESGKGFAVVAQEVRKLAEQSASSAEQIGELISTIQAETKQAVHWMDAGSEEVVAGIEAVHLAGKAFQDIQQAVLEVKEEIQEVTAAAEQMTASTELVAHSLDSISAIADRGLAGSAKVASSVQEQLSSMEEIASFTAGMADMSLELQGEIQRFKL
ncbi:methyl-accepting chemotaxis protein [Paenibacillus turpanensis]|uniref:methyl-accepting chemotaxis protein n=1 Tax=Paenibacillus turpanensis TaxID=2689078 RepID=UPI00140D48E2|nr:methyl-accepting chemotaxis protein [Paenibacillus turpanensis]